jgi:Putative DNA-binding domain
VIDASFESFFSVVTSGEKISGSPGMLIYQRAYWARLIQVLRNTFPCVAFVADEIFDSMAREFFRDFPPTEDSIDLCGQRFSLWLATNDAKFDLGVETELLADLAKLEWTMAQVLVAPDFALLPLREISQLTSSDWETQRFQLRDDVAVLKCGFPVFEIWKSLVAQVLVDPPAAKSTKYLVHRKENRVHVLELSLVQQKIVEAFKGPQTLQSVFASTNEAPELFVQELAGVWFIFFEKVY